MGIGFVAPVMPAKSMLGSQIFFLKKALLFLPTPYIKVFCDISTPKAMPQMSH